MKPSKELRVLRAKVRTHATMKRAIMWTLFGSVAAILFAILYGVGGSILGTKVIGDVVAGMVVPGVILLLASLITVAAHSYAERGYESTFDRWDRERIELEDLEDKECAAYLKEMGLD